MYSSSELSALPDEAGWQRIVDRSACAIRAHLPLEELESFVGILVLHGRIEEAIRRLRHVIDSV